MTEKESLRLSDERAERRYKKRAVAIERNERRRREKRESRDWLKELSEEAEWKVSSTRSRSR